MAQPAFEGMKFGADPELFVVDGDGNAICPTFLEGTKENPEPVVGGALQRDGFAAEFNIDPAESYSEWESRFKLVLKELESRLPSGHTLAAKPSMYISQKVWDNSPDDAKALGCSPDFNAWTGEINPVPDQDKFPLLRTTAGHIHFGWDEKLDPSDEQYCAAARDLVKQLDWYLGAWSIQRDKDPTRRNLYGKAGAMRFKPYGVEYRVLSNFWVMSPTLRRQVWDRMQFALQAMSGHYYPAIMESPNNGYKKYDFNKRLIESINSSVLDGLLVAQFNFPIREV